MAQTDTREWVRRGLGLAAGSLLGLAFALVCLGGASAANPSAPRTGPARLQR